MVVDQAFQPTISLRSIFKNSQRYRLLMVVDSGGRHHQEDFLPSRFGQNTDGLERKVTPQYKVNLEDLKFLGEAEPPPRDENQAGEEAAK